MPVCAWSIRLALICQSCAHQPCQIFCQLPLAIKIVAKQISRCSRLDRSFLVMSLISIEPLWRQSDMGQRRHANGMEAGARLMCLMPRLMPKRRLRFLACGVAVCKLNQAGLIIFIRVVVDGCCKAVHCWRNLVSCTPKWPHILGYEMRLSASNCFWKTCHWRNHVGLRVPI